MKSLKLLLVGAAFTLIGCGGGAEQVTYEEFYQKTQEIEDHHYSEATLTIWYFSDMTSEGETTKADVEKEFKYAWNSEVNRFVPSDGAEDAYGNELSTTVKKTFANKTEEPEDLKDFGCQYFIDPFKTYIDYTETIETRTIRTIQSYTYDEYGYMTDYLLNVEADGTYKDQPVSGVQITTYSVVYK